MLEDEHRLSLGMLMHVKCIHELCSLLSYIPTYLHVIRCMFYIDLWGFFINPLSLVYNSAEQETFVFGIFKFQGPYGTQIGLGFFWSHYFSRRHSLRRITGGGPGGPNEHRWCEPHRRPRHPYAFPPGTSAAVRLDLKQLVLN